VTVPSGGCANVTSFVYLLVISVTTHDTNAVSVPMDQRLTSNPVAPNAVGRLGALATSREQHPTAAGRPVGRQRLRRHEQERLRRHEL